MNTRTLVLTAACLLGVWVLAQKPQEYTFKDKAGKLKLWNTTSHETNYTPNGPITFEGQGKPVKGQSVDQGLDLETDKIEAVLEPATGGSYLLKSAVLTGNVKLDQAKDTAEGKLTRKLSTQKATLEDSSAVGTVTLPGAFNFLQSQDGRSIALSAGSGSLSTDPFRQKKSELRSAHAAGAVTLTSKESTRELEVKSAALDLVNAAGLATVTLPNPFTSSGWNLPAKGGRQDLTASGSSGKIVFKLKPAKDEPSVQEMEISGSVSIRIVDLKPGPEEKTTIITANAPKLTYSLAKKQYLLSGGVDYSVEFREKGKDPIGGDGRSEEVAVNVNAAGELVDYKAKSGTATVSEKKP